MMPSPPAVVMTTAKAMTAVSAVPIATTPISKTDPGAQNHVQVLPPPQVLPLYGRKRQRDRLQGSQHAASVHHRKRQDRAQPHHRHQGALSASAGCSHQARSFPGAAAVHG